MCKWRYFSFCLGFNGESIKIGALICFVLLCVDMSLEGDDLENRKKNTYNKLVESSGLLIRVKIVVACCRGMI